MSRFVLCMVLAAPLSMGCASATSTTAPTDPAKGQETFTPEDLIGKSFEEVIRLVPLALEEYPVIEEPPFVGRGIRAKSPDGDEVWLYVARDKAIHRDDGDLSAKQFFELPVAGVAVLRQGEWRAVGEVILYYHWNIKKLPK